MHSDVPDPTVHHPPGLVTTHLISQHGGSTTAVYLSGCEKQRNCKNITKNPDMTYWQFCCSTLHWNLYILLHQLEIIQYSLLLQSALLLCKSSSFLSGRGKLATTKQLSVRNIHIQMLPFSFPTLKVLVCSNHVY